MKRKSLVLVAMILLMSVMLTGCTFLFHEVGVIKFETNGGTPIADIEEDVGSIVRPPKAPTKNGFEFAGWYSDKALTTPYVFGVMESGERTLYAKWKNVLINVTLVGNGGTGQNIGPYKVGDTINLSNVKWTREGYKFAGWYLKEDLSGNRIDNYTVEEVKDLTFYAKWIKAEPGVHIVTLNGNGGTGTKLDSYKEGTVTPLPKDWTREGYDFGGWYNNASFTGKAIDAIAPASRKDATFWAKWIPKSYTITFVTNGGSALAPLTKHTDESLALPTPTFGGKILEGWYLDSALLNKFTDTTMPPRNITLYAKWVDSYELNYVSDGNVVLTNKEVGKTVILVDPANYDFNRPDYIFEGWYRDSAFTEKLGQTVDVSTLVDKKVYAKWTDRSFFDLKNDFDTAVKNDQPIIIESELEFIKFLDYVSFTTPNPKGGKDIRYKFKLQYMEDRGKYDKRNLANEIQTKLAESMTASVLPNMQYTDLHYGYSYVTVSAGAVDRGYRPVPNNQMKKAKKVKNVFSMPYTKKRADTFDDFKYKKYTRSLDVETSNELFYALQYRIKPIPVVGSPAEKMLNKAKEVLRNICDDSMTDVAKVYAMYSWFIDNVYYDQAALSLPDDYNIANEYDCFHLEGVFNGHLAVCDGMSKALSVMAGIEGISCIRVAGDGHAWNRIYLDTNNDGVGAWYGIDVTWANTNVAGLGEVASIRDFLFTDTYKTSKGKTATNQKEIVAKTDTSPYEVLKFSIGGKTFDLNITSFEELDVIADYVSQYFNNNPTANKASMDISYATSLNKDAIIKRLNSRLGVSFVGRKISVVSSINGSDPYAIGIILQAK